MILPRLDAIRWCWPSIAQPPSEKFSASRTTSGEWETGNGKTVHTATHCLAIVQATADLIASPVKCRLVVVHGRTRRSKSGRAIHANIAPATTQTNRALHDYASEIRASPIVPCIDSARHCVAHACTDPFCHVMLVRGFWRRLRTFTRVPDFATTAGGSLEGSRLPATGNPLDRSEYLPHHRHRQHAAKPSANGLARNRIGSIAPFSRTRRFQCALVCRNIHVRTEQAGWHSRAVGLPSCRCSDRCDRAQTGIHRNPPAASAARRRRAGRNPLGRSMALAYRANTAGRRKNKRCCFRPTRVRTPGRQGRLGYPRQ